MTWRPKGGPLSGIGAALRAAPSLVRSPAWTGGALQFVNWVGVAKFVTRADQLAGRYGERFAPPRLLRPSVYQSSLLKQVRTSWAMPLPGQSCKAGRKV